MCCQTVSVYNHVYRHRAELPAVLLRETWFCRKWKLIQRLMAVKVLRISDRQFHTQRTVCISPSKAQRAAQKRGRKRWKRHIIRRSAVKHCSARQGRCPQELPAARVTDTGFAQDWPCQRSVIDDRGSQESWAVLGDLLAIDSFLGKEVTACSGVTTGELPILQEIAPYPCP